MLKHLFCCLVLSLFTATLGCAQKTPAQAAVYAPGETFTYAIKKFGMRAGTATLVYHGPVEVSGTAYVQIVFTAKGFNFFDEEKIFADPETFLPLRVERDLNIFGKKEQIVETYDPNQGKVSIKKYKGKEMIEEASFEKDRPIDNLYCFLFRYRMSGQFEAGQTFQMFLPTKDVEFEIVGLERISFYPGEDEAWYMESRPASYRIWFNTKEGKMPLRIDGAVGMAKTAMILEDYKPGKIE